MTRIIIILAILVIGSFSMAENHVRVGTRSGNLSLGFGINSTQNQELSMGYGALIMPSSSNPLGVFMCLNSPFNILINPNYLSTGLVFYKGNSDTFGVYLHLGWAMLFNSPLLSLESGIEILNNRPVGLNIELLYAF